MSQLSPRLSLPYLQPAQAQKHVTHNEALSRLDVLVQLTVLGFDATDPPAQSQDDEVWAIGAGATGAWAGQDGQLACWSNGGWVFISPQMGWRAAKDAELRIWTGATWDALTGGDLENVAGVGVNTTSDATNRLSVSSAATLLSHDGADHRVVINKAAIGDTASLVFQTGFSGRAEMGTAGSDDFAIKVSDGSQWHTAMQADTGSGEVDFPNGVSVTGQVSGTAVTQSAVDQTSGRLLKTGDFGLGTTISLTAADDLDTLVGSGLYYNPTGGNCPGNHYPLSSAGALMHLRRASTNCVQIFSTHGANLEANRMRQFVRSRGNAGWTPWVEIMNQGTMVGTVSQSGGVPTGAIIEKGENANGSYVRFADGTQMCSATRTVSAAIGTAFLGGFRSAPNSWSFPAQFVSGATPVVTGVAVDETAFGLTIDGSTTHAATAWHVTAIASQGPATRTVNLSAVGRWY